MVILSPDLCAPPVLGERVCVAVLRALCTVALRMSESASGVYHHIQAPGYLAEYKNYFTKEKPHASCTYPGKTYRRRAGIL